MALEIQAFKSVPPQDFCGIGYGTDVSILELAQKVAVVTGYKGRIVTDPSKPDGTMRKLLDVSRLAQMGWSAQIGLDQGLAATYQWFVAHSKTVRR